MIQANNKAFGKPSDISSVLNDLKSIDKSYVWYQVEIMNILREIPEEEDADAVKEMLQFFDDDDFFDKYIYLLEKTSGGSAYQHKYHIWFLDSVAMKNKDSMLIADGRRSRRHPRRGVMGSKLLETLVQINILDKNEAGAYYSHSLSIDELSETLRQRYGLIINGVGEERFKDADIQTLAAFKDNMDAFKNKLRQIGFYTDLSDACLLQKIRPRYKI